MVDVEKRATSAIEQQLSVCPRLVSYIDSNDKTPITDGFIVVYRGLGRKNEDITGRLDVQVKGRTTTSRIAPTTFSMTRSELAAIRHHGTLLLFVVFLRPDGSYLGSPKFAMLQPFLIDMLLDQAPKKRKSALINLRDLPTETAQIERIVDVSVHSQGQRMFTGAEYGVLERSTRLTIHSTKGVDLSTPVLFSPETGDFVIEVETPEGVTVPLSGVLEVFPGTYLERETDLTVSCGGVAYRNPRVQQIAEGRHKLTLSPGLSIELQFDEESERLESSSVNLSLVDNLADRVRDIDFFLNLSSLGSITFNEATYGFDLNAHQPLNDLQALRAGLGELVELRGVLHADPALVSLADIDEKQAQQLHYLHASLIRKVGLSAAGDAKPVHVYEKIGSWRLSLLVLPGSEPDSWRYLDPFDPDNRHQFKIYRTDDGESVTEVRGTAYDGVTQQDFPSILNLNLGKVVDAYRVIAELPDTSVLANRCVLNLIHAADRCAARRTEFLDAAQNLNDWLTETEGATSTNLLNHWQTRARRPEGLTANERDEIRALRREILATSGETSALHETGCAILLGDREDVANCVGQLAQDEREALEGYPIWNLTRESHQINVSPDNVPAS